MAYLPDSFESEEQREVWIKRGQHALEHRGKLIAKYEAILAEEREDQENIKKHIEQMKQLPIKPVIKLSDPPGGFN